MAPATFQWGGTISALFLLILNHTGRRSPAQTTLIVLYLVASIPTPLFKVLRGSFGYWISFFAVAANVFFPKVFPVSRFLLLVLTPDLLLNGLRHSVAGGVFCLIVGIWILLTELQGIGELRNCEYNFRCLCFCLGMACLLYFTIMFFF